MKRELAGATLALFALMGCRTAQVESDPEPMPPPAGAESGLLAPGTVVEVELDETLSAKENEKGDSFTATVTEDVSQGGRVVVPEGSKVHGKITGVDASERVGEQAAIRLAFDAIEVNGQTHGFNAEVTDVEVSAGDRTRIGETREKAGVGAAAGAVLGAVVGGSLKDLLIGGVLGAGVGTIISLGMGDVESALPEGSELTLRATQTVASR